MGQTTARIARTSIGRTEPQAPCTTSQISVVKSGKQRINGSSHQMNGSVKRVQHPGKLREASFGSRAISVVERAREEMNGKSNGKPEVEKLAQEVGPLDALQRYLRDIGRTPLISVEAENDLAKRIRRGDKKAVEELVEANLRLVVKIARDYEGLGLPLLDLINEGNIGLMKACRRFDPRKGGKLSTYASWWIKMKIRRALSETGRTIRLPVEAGDTARRIHRTSLRLQGELGREPEFSELSKATGVAPKKIMRLMEAYAAPISLDAPMGEDPNDSDTVGDLIKDSTAPNPVQVLTEKNDIAILERCLRELDAREQRILRLRFGLDSGEEKTLEEVGARFNLTRERIRQIQGIALRKLRGLISRVGGFKELS